MFTHEIFDKYSFEEIPLDRDIYLMDEEYMSAYEDMMLKMFSGGEYEIIGEISYFAIRSINSNSLEASWYPNIYTRFHEVSVSIPRNEILYCVGSWNYDEKPRIFIKSGWLDKLYLRNYSVFGLVDAVGVKNALESGKINRANLSILRNEIDMLSSRYKHISFVSFADSLLLKSNWTTIFNKYSIEDTYHPEQFLFLAKDINEIYENTLGLNTYTILVQGSNEYYEDPLLHISTTGNHISLNSLGIPFAQLQAIEHFARKAIKKKIHGRSQIYMDSLFYHSLSFEYTFNKHNEPNYQYQAPMKKGKSKYFSNSIDYIIAKLKQN